VRYRLGMGVGLSGIIGALAYWRHALTRSGVLGAMVIGTTIFGFGGLGWGLVLIFFFVSSTLLSHLRSEEKRRVAADKFSKAGARDWQQTMANGGMAALVALVWGLRRCQPRWLQGAFVGALATATADTWATEVGTLSRSQPRLITSGRRVPPGTSGGLTLRGTAATAAGGLALGAAAMLAAQWGACRHAPMRDLRCLPVIGLGTGLAGALSDSLLGATLQRVAYCPVCASETERAVHFCGTTTVPLRGLRWMDNDAVNFLSTVVGALIGGALSAFFA
jgi:uncharacterized protein (TIGR00297 family)